MENCRNLVGKSIVHSHGFPWLQLPVPVRDLRARWEFEFPPCVCPTLEIPAPGISFSSFPLWSIPRTRTALVPSPQRFGEAAGAGILCRESSQPLQQSGNSSGVKHPSPVQESSAGLGLAWEGAASWNSLLEQGSLERTGQDRTGPSVETGMGGKFWE